MKKQYPQFTYLPNVVGDHFKPIQSKRDGKWIYFRKKLDRQTSDFLSDITKRYDIKIDIPSRRYPYADMPQILNCCEGLVDQRSLPALSVLALESLKCGLKVLTWGNRIIESFPREHETESVVNRLIEIYKDTLSDD